MYNKEYKQRNIRFIHELLVLAHRELEDLKKEELGDRILTKIDLAETKVDAAMSNLESMRLSMSSNQSKTMTINREDFQSLWENQSRSVMDQLQS